MENKPEVWPWLQGTWNDYGYLIAGRQTGWGVGTIPPSEVFAYTREMHPNWGPGRLSVFLFIITALDRVHRDFLNEKAESKK